MERFYRVIQELKKEFDKIQVPPTEEQKVLVHVRKNKEENGSVRIKELLEQRMADQGMLNSQFESIEELIDDEHGKARLEQIKKRYNEKIKEDFPFEEQTKLVNGNENFEGSDTQESYEGYYNRVIKRQGNLVDDNYEDKIMKYNEDLQDMYSKMESENKKKKPKQEIKAPIADPINDLQNLSGQAAPKDRKAAIIESEKQRRKGKFWRVTLEILGDGKKTDKDPATIEAILTQELSEKKDLEEGLLHMVSQMKHHAQGFNQHLVAEKPVFFLLLTH